MEVIGPAFDERVTDAGYSAIAFDDKGWGSSEGPSNRLDPYGRVWDAHAALTVLAQPRNGTFEADRGRNYWITSRPRLLRPLSPNTEFRRRSNPPPSERLPCAHRAAVQDAGSQRGSPNI